MNTSKSSSDFGPLLKALQQITQWLGNEDGFRILIASHHLREFKSQELAAHNTIIKHQMLGNRVSVRGCRHADQPRKVIARWWEDKLLEAAHPTLHFILQGQADMRAANYSVHCLPGDAIFYPAGIPKSDGSVPDYVNISPDAFCDTLMFSPGELFGQGLECSIAHSRDNKLILNAADEGCWVKNIQIAQLYTGLSDELEAKGNTKIAHQFLSLILALLQREIKDGNASSGWQFSTVPTPQVRQTLIQRAIEYMQANQDQRLTIDGVARHAGMSRTAFTVEFRRETGQSFREYLIDHRLEYAKVLLKDANHTVNRIGELVGLSPGRLRALFHEKFQCSPETFRKS